jgi:hypothetical protein
MIEQMPTAGEPIADYRARIARRQAEYAEVRQRELIEQASAVNTPEMRIRIWERLHEITMPREATHRLVQVIAAQTRLTVSEVHAEQQNRANPAPAMPADPGQNLSGEPHK